MARVESTKDQVAVWLLNSKPFRAPRSSLGSPSSRNRTRPDWGESGSSAAREFRFVASSTISELETPWRPFSTISRASHVNRPKKSLRWRRRTFCLPSRPLREGASRPLCRATVAPPGAGQARRREAEQRREGERREGEGGRQLAQDHPALGVRHLVVAPEQPELARQSTAPGGRIRGDDEL